MNKEMKRYLCLWAKTNTTLFHMDNEYAEYPSPEAFIEHEHTAAYRYRMHKYVKTFNSTEGFSTLHHWYKDKVRKVNTIESTDGGNLLVNNIVIPAESFIPIFSSYWKRVNPNCNLTDLGLKKDTSRGPFVTSEMVERYAEVGGRQKVNYNPEKQNYKITVDGNSNYYSTDYFTNLKETKTMNTLEMKSDAKSSIKLATDLAKGRTALATVHGLITKILPIKFSWFAKLTGKDKAIVESPYTKLAGAAVAHAIAIQFDNSKVAQVTKLAQDAALVEVASLIPIEDFVAQLTETITDKLDGVK